MIRNKVYLVSFEYFPISQCGLARHATEIINRLLKLNKIQEKERQLTEFRKETETYEKLKRIRMHGVDDVINCTFHQMGFNFRFTDIQASMGLAQLDRVQKRILHLNKVYLKYKEGIKDLPFLKFIPVNIANGEIPIYIEVLCKNREKLINFLASHNIQTRPFYPCLNTAKHLNILDVFPNADVFGDQGLVLPCGPEQSFENIDRVIKVLRLFK